MNAMNGTNLIKKQFEPLIEDGSDVELPHQLKSFGLQ